MKKKFSRNNLPPFLRNSTMRWIMLIIFALSIYGIVISFLSNAILGIIVAIIICAEMAYSINRMNEMSLKTTNYISDLSYRIKRGEEETTLEMPVGVLILNASGVIEWVNPFLQPYFGDKNVLGENISDAAPGLKSLIEQYWNSKTPQQISWNHHQFSMLVEKEYRSVYMIDITRYTNIEKRYDDEKVALGQIFLDNYDEITQSMSDQEISNLTNYVTNELTSWARSFGIYLKQIDDDHFLMLLYQKSLEDVERDKFQILDSIRERTSKRNLPLTLSIGIAYGETDLNELANQAQNDLNLALGRGGDQVVVKALDHSARFYGGKTNPMEKRTRVRARMTSQALQGLMKESDQIFVQGHQQPDMDALGACMGIRRISEMNKKKCWIVVDEKNLHSDVQRLLKAAQDYPEIRDSIISPEEAVKIATDSSIMIMVDHSRPSMNISSALYDRLSNRVIVIDHHRRSEEFPKDPLLVYIEPYASSTCELITEMFEYQSKNAEPINKLEATAMLAGIFIDTQSFSSRTGTRTFDAASYLRSAGADAEEMQHFMRENVDDYMNRTHLISSVKLMGDNHELAVVTGEQDKVYDPVVAAQAADSLLKMSGIEASFVISNRPDKRVGISARSLGNVNVQLIMERLGGGGHLSSGAAQISDKKPEDVQKMLLDAIKEVKKQEIPDDDDDSKQDK
ncbi:DHH family phosphoesterase [Philodulcilactobacillus myokoensis]|nr:DHH family phosphoesterase [Philodulcilactobacillus myokoensis]